MDNFMEKIAQKLNAQDIIRANSAAEAMEMKKVQMQVSEYEKIIQEMRKVTLKSMGAATQVQLLAEASIKKVEEIVKEEQNIKEDLACLKESNKKDFADLLLNNKEDFSTLLERNKEEFTRFNEKYKEDFILLNESTKEELNFLEKSSKEDFARLDESVHKENVKVYRNVQAVVVEGFKVQDEKIIKLDKAMKDNISSVKIVAILILAVVVVDLGMHIASILGIL